MLQLELALRQLASRFTAEGLTDDLCSGLHAVVTMVQSLQNVVWSGACYVPPLMSVLWVVPLLIRRHL